MNTNGLFKWMQERHRIFQHKIANKPKPWTKDPIMQQYKFCNVYRELDTVTIWIAKNWRLPHSKDSELWFAMTVARLVNWPATLQTLGYPVPWDSSHFVDCLIKIGNKNEAKVWGGAYIVSTNGQPMSKPVYIATQVLDPMWEDRGGITTAYEQAKTLQAFHQRLMHYDGLGSFLAAQVIADLKYVKPLNRTLDWYTWAASGPGSRRGMNRVLNQDLESPWTESVWLATLQTLHAAINKRITAAQMPELHAQDLQNCLCEFDKYERTRLGEGRPRATYNGRSHEAK